MQQRVQQTSLDDLLNRQMENHATIDSTVPSAKLKKHKSPKPRDMQVAGSQQHACFWSSASVEDVQAEALDHQASSTLLSAHSTATQAAWQTMPGQETSTYTYGVVLRT